MVIGFFTAFKTIAPEAEGAGEKSVGVVAAELSGGFPREFCALVDDEFEIDVGRPPPGCCGVEYAVSATKMNKNRELTIFINSNIRRKKEKINPHQ